MASSIHTAALLVSIALVACQSGPSPAAPAAPPLITAAGPTDACGGDGMWLQQILGRPPTKSGLERLDVLARQPGGAQAIASPAFERGIDGDGGWFKHVIWQSQEAYEWESGGHKVGSVVVARNVTGKDPRTLGSFGHEPDFGAPTRLPSGVLEYPPNPASREPHASGKRHLLYAFPDATWIIVDEWMASRFRIAFERTSASPPLPPTPSDVFVEYCFPGPPEPWQKGDDGTKAGGLTLRGDHMSLRYVGFPVRLEQLYTFATPALAAAAVDEQRQRCARTPCAILSVAVEGRVVRYVMQSH